MRMQRLLLAVLLAVVTAAGPVRGETRAVLASEPASGAFGGGPRTWRLDYFHTGGLGAELFSLDRVVVEPLPWPGNASEPLVASASDPTLGAATTDGAPSPAGSGETEDDPLTALIKAIVGGQPAERK